MKENDSVFGTVKTLDDQNKPDSLAHFDHDYGLSKNFKTTDQFPKNKFDLLGSPLREFIHPISSSSEESEWILRCDCQNKDKNESMMICCDNCNGWSHIACVGLDLQHLPVKYFCGVCQNENPESYKIIYNQNKPKSVFNKTVIPKIKHKYDKISSNESLSSHTSSTKSNPLIVNNIMEHDQSNKSPYECDCISKIISILNTENLNENSHIFDNLAKNKNCHSFTLKNGQKILKSSKIIEESKFICEIKGNLHILEDCILMQHNYNCFSSFIYTLKLSPYVILAIDARTSTHISRYIRRSCIPNAQLSCYINPETPQIVKTFLFSLEMIDKHKEITISVDRSKEYFIRFPSCSSKHHWQKYDYSSSLLCLCNFSTKTELESSKTTTNHQNKTTVCAVKEIKTVIKYHRNSVKKSAGVETKSSSPIIENMKSETNSEENNIPIVSVENTQGLSREQKKINYWLRVINEMEEESPKPIKSSRRGRKPNKSIRVDSHLNQEAVSLNSKKPSSPDSSMENNTKFNAVVTTENVILTENQHNISQKKNKSEQQRSWYFPSQMTDLLFKNKTAFSHLDNTISDTSNHNLTTHRRTQVPIKLALRRGLYHLIPNQFLSDNYQQNLNKSETTIISDVSLNNRKRQFNERENIKKNNILPTATVINTQEPPKIKKELPIPELRPTLPSTKNIISNNNNIFQ